MPRIGHEGVVNACGHRLAPKSRKLRCRSDRTGHRPIPPKTKAGYLGGSTGLERSLSWGHRCGAFMLENQIMRLWQDRPNDSRPHFWTDGHQHADCFPELLGVELLDFGIGGQRHISSMLLQHVRLSAMGFLKSFEAPRANVRL